MTREEAIHFAECLKHNWTIDFNDMEDFCDMAIEALSERTGEWIPHDMSVGDKEYIEYSRCSECGEIAFVRTDFCGHCGADMIVQNNET